MRGRCRNPRNPKFQTYGARGITICARWDDFANFLADMGEPPPGATIDRIDNDGPYSPENCRWATAAVQVSNRRVTPKLTARGRTASIDQWAPIVGLNRKTIRARIRKGWSAEAALFTPRQDHIPYEQRGPGN